MTQKIPIDLDTELKKCKTMDDLLGKNGLIKRLLGGMIEGMIEQEMTDHLGYEKNSIEGNNTGNSRNGKSKKTLKSSFGNIDINLPRDRNGEFEPQIVPKHKRSINAFEDKILSMYAKGMSTRDIQSHIEEIYGAEISPTFVSSVTDKIVDLAMEWQSRPLEKVYPIVYFDAIHYKVRENGSVVSKATYTCLGIAQDGTKDVLGIWVGESEGAKFWLGVCTELKNRGVEDIFIACIDGLKGLPEAIESVFPKIEIQLCIIHMIRNSIKYVAGKYYKEFISELREVYRASSEVAGKHNLEKMKEKWDNKYPLAFKVWDNNWHYISTFYKYLEPIRKIIYTTNAVEALHRQFRKVTKSKGVFPTDQALLKILFLVIRDKSKRWNVNAVKGWKEALSYFSLAFENRLQLN